MINVLVLADGDHMATVTMGAHVTCSPIKDKMGQNDMVRAAELFYRGDDAILAADTADIV